MSTLTPPAGDTGRTFLSRFEEEFNAGGPVVEVRRQHLIAELDDGWRLTADVYLPPESGPQMPALLYLHGGAWVIGSPLTHDRMARMLAAGGYLVASIDYPRAPRRRFPAGLSGCLRALDWLAGSAASLGAEPTSLFVAGDSAGANLAAATAVTTDVPLRAAALLYGIYDVHRALPALAPIVGGAAPEDQEYVPAAEFDALRGDPRLSPEAAADRLPPCWIGVGTRDPLLAESLALADALPPTRHELFVADGSPHSFLQLPFDAHYDEGWRAAIAFLDGYR